MARYLVLWKANASAWPTDPREALKVIEGVTAGGDMLLQGGMLKELGWFTAQEGYGIFEAESKATVVGQTAPFFPLYDQEVREVVPWEDGKQAILESARQMASR